LNRQDAKIAKNSMDEIVGILTAVRVKNMRSVLFSDPGALASWRFKPYLPDFYLTSASSVEPWQKFLI
jgi:hypothetical protein